MSRQKSDSTCGLWLRRGCGVGLRTMSTRPASTNGNESSETAIHVQKISPPPLFAHVCPYIYRSADPSTSSDSFAFLDTLSIKSVVLLSIEYPSKQLEIYCARNQIELYHFGIERRWPTPNLLNYGHSKPSSNLFLSSHEINSFSVLESIVKDALELLLDIRNHPILVTDMYVIIRYCRCPTNHEVLVFSRPARC